MFRVLLVEDDNCLRTLIATNLRISGFLVTECSNGVEALAKLENNGADIVVADIMMPQMDGHQLTQAIKRDYKDIPVVILTALDNIADKKVSFIGGADDYLVKPVDFEELELRLRAILRRYGNVSTPTIKVGNTVVNYTTRTVRIDGVDMGMRNKEFLLLYVFASGLGKIFTREQLLNEIWGRRFAKHRQNNRCAYY